MRVAFTLLFQGRSGSTYVIDMLNSHPHAEARGEGLVRLMEAGAAVQVDWTRDFFAKPRPECCLAVGFKTKLSDVLDPGSFAACLEEAHSRIIHLERRDLFKQTVSWMRADLLHAATGCHNTRDLAFKPAAKRLDPEEFQRRIRLLRSGQRALREYVAYIGLPTLHVHYERLLEDPTGTFAELQEFLDLPQHALSSTYVKITNDNLLHDVPNLQELRDAVCDPYCGRIGAFDGADL
jgi:LPS sulfotransferase NodH